MPEDYKRMTAGGIAIICLIMAIWLLARMPYHFAVQRSHPSRSAIGIATMLSSFWAVLMIVGAIVLFLSFPVEPFTFSLTIVAAVAAPIPWSLCLIWAFTGRPSTN